jgi:hypothetical protein
VTEPGNERSVLRCPAPVGMRERDDRHDPKTAAISDPAGIGRLRAVQRVRSGEKPPDDIPA